MRLSVREMPMRTFALIPAAGLSRRMGRPKLLLPLGSRTVVEHVIAALRSGGVADILVVTGPEGGDVADIAERNGASVVRLGEQTPDMATTCRRGLARLEELQRPQPDDGFLLVPADHPTLEPEVVRAVLAAAAAGASLVVPVHGGRRGHPAWICWRHVDAIRALLPGQGLNQFIRQHASQTVELPWAGSEVLSDLDTPEDYERLLREYSDR